MENWGVFANLGDKRRFFTVIAEAFYGKEKIFEFLEKPIEVEKDLGVLGENVSLPLGEGEVENRRFGTRGRLSPLDFIKKSDAEFVKNVEKLDKVS